MLKSRCLAAAFAASLTSFGPPPIATAAAIAGCPGSIAPEVKKVPLAAMRIETPIYLMQASGHFTEVDLSENSRKVISEGAFTDPVHMMQSANGRWIAYDGKRKDTKREQFWLFDRKTKLHRIIYDRPRSGGVYPEFSPDSNYVVIDAIYERRWASETKAGLLLFDTARSKLTTIRLPTTIPAKEIRFSPQWSKNGEELLILVLSFEKNRGAVPFEYYSYRLSTSTVERLKGHYDSTAHRHVFLRDGREIEAFGGVDTRSTGGRKMEDSPDRKWHAYVDWNSESEGFPLRLEGRDGSSRIVARGTAGRGCAHQLFKGWLDNDHLVFLNSWSDHIVYEVSTGSIARLFEGERPLQEFTW
ncbi:MAG TPA: hypothetical protein VGD52_06970 [Pseudoduganella sp.]